MNSIIIILYYYIQIFQFFITFCVFEWMKVNRLDVINEGWNFGSGLRLLAGRTLVLLCFLSLSDLFGTEIRQRGRFFFVIAFTAELEFFSGWKRKILSFFFFNFFQSSFDWHWRVPAMRPSSSSVTLSLLSSFSSRGRGISPFPCAAVPLTEPIVTANADAPAVRPLSASLVTRWCWCFFLFLMMIFLFNWAGDGSGTPGSSYQSIENQNRSKNE